MQFSERDKKFFKKSGINTVYLFGSRAQNIGKEKSDFDVAILFKDTSKLRNRKNEMYQRLYELFADHFQTKSNIDIVLLHNAGGQLRYHVVKDGAVLYDGDPKLRGQFEEYVILEHADFEYFRRLFEESIMKRAA